MLMMLLLAYEAVFRRKTTENSPEIAFAVVLQDRTNQFQANEHQWIQWTLIRNEHTTMAWPSCFSVSAWNASFICTMSISQRETITRMTLLLLLIEANALASVCANYAGLWRIARTTASIEFFRSPLISALIESSSDFCAICSYSSNVALLASSGTFPRQCPSGLSIDYN